MELTYAELSSPGPARENNEDFVGFWQPETIEEKRGRGAVAALADGVGGMHRGEVASRLAVETALKTFREAPEAQSPQQLLIQMFSAANIAVYDKGMEDHGKSPMATTLCIVIFRNDEIVVGNVGDSRVYLVRKTEIKQLSTDHTYVGMQQKFGMITEQDARTSEKRSVLTRSVGHEPLVRPDVESTTVFIGDRVVLCSDGLYSHVADNEIADIVSRYSPAQACRQLIALAEQRGTDDNLSAQVLQINDVEKMSYYRGVPIYDETAGLTSRYELRPGQTLDERFLILETISRSGMATIFRATDLKTKQTVAVKVPLMEFESDPGFYSRFQREEEIGNSLNHPYILKFIPVEEEHRSRPYIVTEYLHGYTLSHLLNSVRPMPEKDAIKIASYVCDALAHMHENGVIHRDLKPQNIMICYDGTIRIMDFGIARAAEGRRITFAGFTPAVGTPDYMAPEQVKGKRGDARTDIYSLGAMLYEMAVGVVPFDGDNAFAVMNARVTGDPVAPRKRNPKVSPQVEEIILHAMEREPGNRYPSSAAMKAELDNPGTVDLTGRCDRLQSPAAWKRGAKKALWITLAVSVPVLVFLLVLFLIIHRGTAH
ncbi:MAG: protein kinase [Dissulfurispiraceae bacterium]|jgi:serine/threonine-protein kinase